MFLSDIRDSLLLISAIALLLAILVAALLARHILNPVRTLAGAVRRLTAGDFSGHAESKRRDELGQLTRDFNLLARTLAANERSRRRWVADISHELRTPLASLRAEIEAIQDGVMELDEAMLASLHAEVIRLGRLVDDLHQLAQADAGELQYRRERCDPVELVEQVAAGMAHRFHQQGLVLDLGCNSEDGAGVFGDPNRLVQLFRNLLENSARYTDRGGRVEVRGFSQVPVIMVTARVEEVDRLLGLDLGADDYLCKPFSPRELVARVRAVLRRLMPVAGADVAGSSGTTDGPFDCDEEQMRITLRGRVLSITATEFRLLHTLIKQPGRIWSRTQMLDLAQPEQLDSYDRVIDTHVKNLRKKLAAIEPGSNYIRSVYGVGYKLELSD